MFPHTLACFGIAAILLSPASAMAQSSGPVPLYPGAAPPRTYQQQELPPVPSAPADTPPPDYRPPAGAANPPPYDAPPRGSISPPPPAPAAAAAPATDRVFCTQQVTVRVADRDSIAERYRPFVGIWSDASWTPQLCAALIVENIAPDGTASIVYAFGPMGSGSKPSGGVLHGTGIVKDGELRFQNSDGSQYAFRPIYSDLDGKYTTPQGQTYGAVFKRAM